MLKLKLILLAIATASAFAQSDLPPSKSGDVFLMDPISGRAYLWIHADSGFIESMPGFSPEQIYRFLLSREEECWDIHSDLLKKMRNHGRRTTR
jgi:hypothetical protein